MAEAAAFGIAGLCFAAVIEVLQRRIVARRQPVTGEGDLALDDAMRSSSLHVLAGAGIALLINIASAMVLISIVTVSPEPVSAALGIASFLLVVPSSLFFWVHSARPHGFRVRWGERRGMKRRVSA